MAYNSPFFCTVSADKAVKFCREGIPTGTRLWSTFRKAMEMRDLNHDTHVLVVAATFRPPHLYGHATRERFHPERILYKLRIETVLQPEPDPLERFRS